MVQGRGCSDCRIWRCLSWRKVQCCAVACSDCSNETMRSLTGAAILGRVLQCHAWRKEQGSRVPGVTAVVWRCHGATWKRCSDLKEEQAQALTGEVRRSVLQPLAAEGCGAAMEEGSAVQ